MISSSEPNLNAGIPLIPTCSRQGRRGSNEQDRRFRQREVHRFLLPGREKEAAGSQRKLGRSEKSPFLILLIPTGGDFLSLSVTKNPVLLANDGSEEEIIPAHLG